MSLDKELIAVEANTFGVEYNEDDLEGTKKEINRVKSSLNHLIKIAEKMKIEKEEIKALKKKKYEESIKILISLIEKENDRIIMLNIKNSHQEYVDSFRQKRLSLI